MCWQSFTKQKAFKSNTANNFSNVNLVYSMSYYDIIRQTNMLQLLEDKAVNKLEPHFDIYFYSLWFNKTSNKKKVYNKILRLWSSTNFIPQRYYKKLYKL